MGGIPDVMFVIDANKEDLAIKEANVLGIPVIAILDTNVDPKGIAFPVPGNDDARRAVRLYCQAIGEAALAGKDKFQAGAWRDSGTRNELLSHRLDPSILKIGGEIISGVRRLEQSERKRITLETLANITNLDAFDEKLLATVIALVYQEVPLLEQYFVYRDPKDGREYEIERKYLYQNLSSESDWRKPARLVDEKYRLEHVYIYFRAIAIKEKESDAYRNFNRAAAAARV